MSERVDEFQPGGDREDPEDPSLECVYRFGDFTWDPRARQLRRGDDEIAMSPRIADLLQFLLDRPNEAISRDELIDELWQGVVVSDHSLTEAVSRLRRHLGDDARTPTFIQTIPARGFRWIAAVERFERSADGTVGPSVVWPPLWKLALPGALLSGLMVAIGLIAGVLPAALTPGERVTLREIMLPDGSPLVDAAAALSPNQQWVVYVRDAPPRIELLELATGEARVLGPITRLWNARSFYWAPDSETVAFSDRPVGGGDGRIELFDVETGVRTTLLDLPNEGGFVWGWEPNGERLLVYRGEWGDWTTARLALVDRAGNTEREWRAGEARGNAGRVSPDGRWLAVARWGDVHGIISVVPIENVWNDGPVADDHFVDWRTGAQIVDPPCADDPPFWNHRSDQLLFFSFRAGERELWTVTLDEGVPVTGATPIGAPASPYVVQGWMPDGRIMFCSLAMRFDVAVVALDLAGAAVIGQPRYLPRWAGAARNPAWSPDGTRLIFQSNHDDPEGDLYTAAVPDQPAAQVDMVRHLVEPPRPRQPAWAQDSAYYVSPLVAEDGTTWRRQQAMWKQNLDTGARERILPEYGFYGSTTLGMDRGGRWLVFNVQPLRGQADEDTSVLEPGTYLYDLGAADLTRLSADHTEPGAAISHDGRWVAVIGRDDDGELPDRRKNVVLLSVDDGSARVLGRAPDGLDLLSMSFSAEGDYVGFVTADPIPESLCGAGEFWVADLERGRARKVEEFDALLPGLVRFSPVSDEVVVAVTDCDGSAKIYEPRER